MTGSSDESLSQKKLTRPRSDNTKQIYACKIFENEFLCNEDLEMVMKEIRINNMIDSDYCIKHYKTIKTKEHIFMIQEYANCFDLQCLLDQRSAVKQEEARLIVR